MTLLVSMLSTFCLAVFLTVLVRKVAIKKGLVAYPRSDRWHRMPTALCGGIAFYLAFVVGYWLFVPAVPGRRLILAGGTLLFIIGLIDDLYQLRPHVKLIGQLIIASIVVFFGLVLPWTSLHGLNIALTIFFIVGITNAINLLDNMDGLAGGTAVIACEFLMISLLLNGQAGEAILPAILGGAVLGFLLFNFNPASIFMGDCGSMFLGFSIATMALLSNYDRTRNLFAVLLTPVLILMLPIFDTCLVTISRKLSGRSIAQGGRDHTSHRLVALGLSEKRAVWLLYALAAVSGAFALMVRGLQAQMLFWLIPCGALVIVFLGIYLSKVHVYTEGERPKENTILRTLEDFTYKRRVFEILLDVLLIGLAYYGAFLLRFDAGLSAQQLNQFIFSLPLVIAAQLAVFLWIGVYRGLWRFISVEDLIVMTKAVAIGGISCSTIVMLIFGWRNVSLSVLILYPILLLVLLCASRVSFRLLRLLLPTSVVKRSDATPILIYGAGDEGVYLLRQILSDPTYPFTPIGFVTDDMRVAGKVIHGYRIYESRELPALMSAEGVREIFVPQLTISETELRSLRKLGLNLKRVGLQIEADVALAV